MEPGRRRTRRRAHTADEAAAVLRKAWCRLRLSARDPARVPAWDAVVLTAASPEQAALYDHQLARARRLGRFPASTAALAVPDPDAARIGSGAATLHAVASLVRHLVSQASEEEIAEFFPEANGSNDDDDLPLTEASVVRFMSTKHVLLLHAGGDSKRVPWANPMGKAFLPVPYLAGDNPDGPVPLLFDHILAISASARQAFKNQGGMLIMTGDVLPCFDASDLVLRDDAACIVTVPTTLDVASNHGVVVASKDGTEGENYSLCLVDNLLQKPTRRRASSTEGRTWWYRRTRADEQARRGSMMAGRRRRQAGPRRPRRRPAGASDWRRGVMRPWRGKEEAGGSGGEGGGERLRWWRELGMDGS